MSSFQPKDGQNTFEPSSVKAWQDWLKANGAKFGPGYWKTFGPAPGCTINVPNAPVTLEEALAAN